MNSLSRTKLFVTILKIFSKTVMLLTISVVLYLIFLFFLPSNLKYYTGRDTYHAFGDGRFQVMEGGNPIYLSLFDLKKSEGPIVRYIEKYIQKDEYIYLIGSYDDPSKEIVKNQRYTILNYETGEIKGAYATLEEIPEKDRKIFERWINPCCWFAGRCFKK